MLTVIVSYNFEPWLDKCLQSLLNSTHATDVLVVDNASNDETVARIKEEYPEVQLLANAENLGFGKANNLGFETAVEGGYDYVFLVNQDGWVKKDCIEKLMKASEEKVGIISPLHYDGEGKDFDRGFATYFSRGEKSGGYVRVPFVNAAFWLIPMNVLKQVGGFSRLFYHYGEDVDLSNRMQYHGFETRIVSDAVAFHDRSNRPLSEEKYFHTEFVYYLTEFSNINHVFIKSVTLAIGGPLKKAIKMLLVGRFRHAIRYVRLIACLLERSAKVIETRKKNIIGGRGSFYG